MGSRVIGRTLASRWVLPIALAAIGLIFDAVDRDTPYSVVQTGLLDEPSHFAATALCVVALRRYLRLPQAFIVWALIASVGTDLDHIPGYVAHQSFSPHSGGRPYPHSIVTIIVLVAIVAASRRWRSAAAGALFGVVVHLIRDICEGPPGVTLFWPFSEHVYIAGRGVFWAFILIALALALVPGRRPAATRVRSLSASR